MRLDYKILWIEDDEAFIDTIKLEIKTNIEKKGFCPTIDAPEKIPSLDKQDLLKYDLLLIDYNLNSYSNNNGDELIEMIRQNKIYTNIIFYSSDPSKIRQETRDKRLNGIYIFDRTDFELDKIDSFYELLDFFMEKDMDLNSMRGIAMSEVAFFDALIWQIIEQEDCKDLVLEKVKKQKKSSYDGVKNKNADQIWEMVKEKGTIILDSHSRFKLLEDSLLLEKYKADDYKHCHHECYTALKESYKLKILDVRNKLAHTLERKNEEINFIQLRKDFLLFRKLLIELRGNICS